MTDKTLSIVVPAYNEAEVLPRLVSALHAVIDPLQIEWELILVNDGSSDATEERLNALATSDSVVKAVHLARNFGKEAALAAGLANAEGCCIVFIDADLQHPPELIPEMVAAWRRGSDVVNAVKRTRADESPVHGWMAGRFNAMMSAVIGGDMSAASDFKLIDRQVAEALLSCPERNRFFRGLVAWVGFKVASVEFDVREREEGVSKWSLGALFRYSFENIVAFSSLPLRLLAYIGFATTGLGLILLVQTLLHYWAGAAAVGFTTVIAIQILMGGMILVALGVIAVYLSRMYDEQKRRPLFIIRRQPGHETRLRHDGP